MINLSARLQVLYPGIDLLNDVVIQDDGEGARIAQWNRPEPDPTDDQLLAVTAEAKLLADSTAAIAQRKVDFDERVPVGDFIDALMKDITPTPGSDLEKLEAIRQDIKRDNPKEVAIIDAEETGA